MNLNRLILFTKYPTPGFVKTRLIPLLGANASAGLHKTLTEITVNKILAAESICDFVPEVQFTGADHHQTLNWLGPRFVYKKQVDGSLGHRMNFAFKMAFDLGFSKVVAIGCDTPYISPEILSQAFQQLNDNDVIIGPASDGGYYLLGINCFCPDIFENIDWGSSIVLSQTFERIAQRALKVSLLTVLSDIDRPDDFLAFRKRFDLHEHFSI